MSHKRKHAEDSLMTFSLTDRSEPLNGVPNEAGSPQQSMESDVKIIWLDADQIRARKVVTRSRCRSTGKYPSWKMERMLQWESAAERNAFCLLDADSSVRSFNEQPCTIEYFDDEKLRKHTPDVLVEFEDGRKEFWEIKTTKEALEEKIAFRTSLMEESLPRLGYGYRLILAQDLERQPRLRNITTILRLGFSAVTVLDKETIRLAFKKQEKLVWSAAQNGDYGPRGLQVLCRLVLEGRVTVDLDESFTPDTLFTTLNGGL